MSPTAPASSKPSVLFVDDEADFLTAIVRHLRNQFEVSTASDGKSALEVLQRRGPFAVLVSDLRMPGIGGVELLRQARLRAPDTCRVLFTGQLDIEHALAAVNEGAIFRFIVKPCPIIAVHATVKAAAEQYRLVTAERVLLEQTLHASIGALTDVMGLASPTAYGRAHRLRRSVSALASAMHVADGWQAEIAAMLSQIACVTLSPATLEKVAKGQELNALEQAAIARLPAITEQILSPIPRLEPVREILRYAEKHFDGTGPPAGGPAGEKLPWGARALKLVLDLDFLESQSESPASALDMLRERAGWYDPAILTAFVEIRARHSHWDVRELTVPALVPGMILAKDVRTRSDPVFMARGQEITATALEKLKNWSAQGQDGRTMRVVVNGTMASGERLVS